MKVGAVAAARVTGVIDVSASPARTGLVILNRRYNVIIYSPCLLQVSSRAGCLDNLTSPLPNLVIERDQAVGPKPTRHVRIRRLPRSLSVVGHLERGLDMLLPCSIKLHRDSK